MNDRQRAARDLVHAVLTHGIDRFLVPATCVGVRPAGGRDEVYAPYGLALLYEGVLAPNPLIDHRALFQAKAASYRQRWPWLRIETAPLAGARG